MLGYFFAYVHAYNETKNEHGLEYRLLTFIIIIFNEHVYIHIFVTYFSYFLYYSFVLIIIYKFLVLNGEEINASNFRNIFFITKALSFILNVKIKWFYIYIGKAELISKRMERFISQVHTYMYCELK
jgi:hypothetical protein